MFYQCPIFLLVYLFLVGLYFILIVYINYIYLTILSSIFHAIHIYYWHNDFIINN